MNFKKVFGIFGLCMMMSCSVEKVNLSPATSVISEAGQAAKEYTTSGMAKDTHFVLYSSEITNSFSEIPSNFSHKGLNTEIYNLQFAISEFIYAVREHNTVGKEKAIYNYENSYKKIQKLKDKLSVAEREILNRFLVKIKTNVSLIEDLKEDRS